MTYESRTRPYEHQRAAVAAARGREAYAYLMETGTGKTKVAIDEWGEAVAAGDATSLLVVAPAGVYLNWRREVATHLATDLAQRTVVKAWEADSARARREAWSLVNWDGGPRVLLLNVESIGVVQEARDLASEFLRSSAGRNFMVVDESTKIKEKNKRTDRTREVGKLASRRRILSGLPTPRSPLDLYYQFEFLDWRILGYESFYPFRSRYAVIKMTSFLRGEEQLAKLNAARARLRREPTEKEQERILEKRPIVVAYRNKEELQAKVARAATRVQKADCLDLPPRVYEERVVELTAEQRRVYADLVETATAQLAEESHVTATHVLTRLMRLQQVVAGYVMDDENRVVRSIPSNRVAALLEVLEEHDGKAVVWCHFDAVLRGVADALSRKYGPGSVARFWGGNRATREEEERRFLGEPECRFMLSTQPAGGMGRTWVVADLAIYVANGYDLEHRIQSEERVHRIGQERRVTYVDLVSPGTSDERVLNALRRKIDLATEIMGDHYKEWVR